MEDLVSLCGKLSNASTLHCPHPGHLGGAKTSVFYWIAAQVLLSRS